MGHGFDSDFMSRIIWGNCVHHLVLGIRSRWNWVSIHEVKETQLPTPQDETWTDFDGPSWIQYDLFRKNKLPGSENVNLAKFMLRALPTVCQTVKMK